MVGQAYTNSTEVFEPGSAHVFQLRTSDFVSYVLLDMASSTLRGEVGKLRPTGQILPPLDFTWPVS